MSDVDLPAQRPFLSNKTYDALKWVALVGLPAVGALYFGLAGIWELPKAHEIVGTITLVDTFLGLLLGLASKKYAGDGTLDVLESDSSLVNRIELTTPPEELGNKKQIILNVNKVEI